MHCSVGKMTGQQFEAQVVSDYGLSNVTFLVNPESAQESKEVEDAVLLIIPYIGEGPTFTPATTHRGPGTLQ